MSAALTAKTAELERARADVAHFAALAEQYPTSARVAMQLDGARSWERRVVAFLRSSGWEE